LNKIHIKSILVIFLLGASFVSWSQIITTIAGNGFFGISGDGGPAIVAELASPTGVACDASGNLYISDEGDCIRKINTSGIISTIAGMGGIGGYSGDGGPATAAELYLPYGVAVDSSGNIYIADGYYSRIRKVDTSGIISTFAGSAATGYSGDGGPATDAELNNPWGLAVDASGNLLIADWSNYRIRKVNKSGVISTFAGNGTGAFSGDGGQATAAELYLPYGVACDTFGNVYIADGGNNRVRIVKKSGIISTFAGNGFGAPHSGGYSGDGGPAIAAEFYNPMGVVVDNYGNIYIADDLNQRIRIINTSGIISTFAGNGTSGFFGDGGPATSAEFYGPGGLALDASGNIYIPDFTNHRVRKVTSKSLGVIDLSPTSNEVNIYPIPNTGFFTISGITSGQVLELYNYLGQKLSSTIADKTTMQFDISSQANGIYLIRIQNKNGSIFATKKIVKME
jgi:hypothetical protein